MNLIISSIQGRVISGKQVGRTIGFPTANLHILSKIPSLDYGVYGVIVDWKGSKFSGVMNIGIRPTFNDSSQISYEVHLLDFNQHLYGEKINVYICFQVRKEILFKDVSELIQQIRSDVDYVKGKFLIMDYRHQNKKDFVNV
ncbi:riboflavin kinase [Pseudobacillus wudalianchiensis]|uniref:riboflavin kinase n=1 Tax=Pseudobacillus wudalianchiensis TaxID=1743143 RepID=A0A1B9B7E5_9BACI|nr:riboflavin kinase [Bacillus wudalianchiensis]OCA92015.1 hypothetical protein A8F95_19115 [Bacillus wudalianchiensis]